ncbi:MAG: Mut7-C ubiquitin/RNAse domain-containing protein [Clostridiales bacterium]|nr:Mut7-C ubiquitin/RNAse domain-containing protein [Clostridiales bacterium]
MRLNVTIRFYEELNDFIKEELRKKQIETSFYGKRTVKDLIESYGVPHGEVDLILINGESVGFDYIVNDKDLISVYPVFERFNINGLSKLRQSSLRETKFILDVHLGKLAKYLRLLGFDTIYDHEMDDPELALISNKNKRILLTRDKGLLMRRLVERGLFIRNNDPYKQCLEVLEKLDLWDTIHPFSRCMVCNQEIEKIEINTPKYKLIETLIPPKVKEWCTVYNYCSNCHKIYWKGSHWNRMNIFLDKLIEDKNR